MSRPFQFFDREAVASTLLPSLEITCCSGGKGKLVFGDSEGMIRILDASWVLEASFRAHELAVTHLKQMSRTVLVSIGNDPRHEATIKFWDVGKKDRNGRPTSLKTLEPVLRGEKGAPCGVPLRLNLNPDLPVVFRGNTEEGGDAGGQRSQVDGASILSPIVCFDVSEDLDVCVLGLSNGDICLYRGDLLYSRYLRPQLLARDGAVPKPVNFLGLAKGPSAGTYALFAVYEDGIGIWRLPVKAAAVYEQLAEFGAPPECSCLCEDPIAGDLAVARGDGVIFFAQDIAGQGACWAFEGPKRKVSCFRSNVVVVTEEVPEVVSGQRQMPASSAKGAELRRTFNVTIYDVRNKFKVFSGGQRTTEVALFTNIAHVLSDGASIFIITNEGGENGVVRQQLWRLKEKDTQTKLEMFFKKQMYKEAINLAKAQQLDAASIAEIMRRYGDRLCGEGKYDEAVEQYIHAIPEGEPSAIIWKLLDAQRIPNLRRYLEALHAKKAATPDHTTLLLNCYTKLNDLAALDRFVRQPAVQFDTDTAIRVCRQAGHYDKALLLAERNKDHDTCLKIQIEDLQQYAAALALLRTMPVEEAEQHLQRHGRTLVRHLPEETTQVIMDLCTDWPSPAAPIPPAAPSPASPIATTAPFPTPAASPPVVKRSHSAPERFQACFVDAPIHLMRFLEFVLNRGDARLQGSAALWNTLLELYLTGAAEGQERDRQRQLALQLLRNPVAKYDPVHVLMLCQLHQFQEGTIHLYGNKLGSLYEGDEAAAQQQLYADLLHQCIQAKDSASILRLCKSRGRANPNVWLQALQYFVDSPDAPYEAEIREVLQFIDQEQLLPPLAVVRILAKTPKATLASVRDLVTRQLQDDLRGIAADERHIAEFAEDTRERRVAVHELQGAPVIVQSNKCAHCHSALVIPATHFLCKHSFHDRCLGEAEDCPLCQPEVRKVFGIVASLAEGRDNHNAFFAHLRDSGDRFGTIADYFGRDVFNGRYPNPPDWPDSASDSD